MVKDLVIVGSGGIDIVRLIENINADKPTFNLIGFLEKDQTKIGTEILGYPVLGDDDLLLTRFSRCAVVNNVMHTPRIHEKITKKLISAAAFRRAVQYAGARSAADSEKDCGRKLFDRRGCAGGNARGASGDRYDPGLPRNGQTQEHLYRYPAGEHRSEDRPGPYFVQPDRYGDGATGLILTEPAEYPDADGARQADPHGFYRSPGLCAAFGGLQPDRTAHRGPYVGG